MAVVTSRRASTKRRNDVRPVKAGVVQGRSADVTAGGRGAYQFALASSNIGALRRPRRSPARRVPGTRRAMGAWSGHTGDDTLGGAILVPRQPDSSADLGAVRRRTGRDR